jgi:hypothetical protein
VKNVVVNEESNCEEVEVDVHCEEREKRNSVD